MQDASPFTLISGGSSGIGRAIAVSLGKARRLIIHGRDAARLKETRQACARASDHVLWRQDLRDIAAVEGALTQVLTAHSAGIDAFVHCAGMVQVLPARSASLNAAQESLNVNYVSAQQILATLLKKRLNRAPLRHVVLISSIWSAYGARGHSLYCASKAALDGMMRALAVELAPDVRVNSVLPGAVRTSMAEPGMSDPEIRAKLQADYPLGLGQPEDVAKVVQFLISDEARWVTGQQFFVDGGRTVNMSLK